MQSAACQCEWIVPQVQPAAAPVANLLPPSASSAPAPAPQTRITTARPQLQTGATQPRPQSSPAPAPQPTRFTPPPVRKPGDGEKKSPVLKILLASGVFIVCAVGGYFGFIWVSHLQDKAN